MSPGAGAPAPQKVSKKVPERSKNTLQTLSGDSPETSRTVPDTFSRLFGVLGQEAPGDFFKTLSAFRARRARETSVRGGLVPITGILEKIYPLTRNYYENNSLRIFFVILRRFCTLKIFGKEGLFQGITREIRNFSKIVILKIIFRK